MANETLLVLSGAGVPPYSARGITQTLEPIEATKKLARDVNGGLVDLSPPQMRKYLSKVTCSDQDAPALAGIWPGTVLVVDCIPELSFLTTNPAAQERSEVTDSVRISGDFTFYRPRLTMMVTNFQAQKDEYGAVVSWELDLEET